LKRLLTFLKSCVLAPLDAFVSVRKNRDLIWQLTKRGVQGRFKGSYLGMLWSWLIPLLMLLVYTFVFSVIFKARWGTTGSGSRAEFALTLFAGLTLFNFFSEVINKSPALVLSNPNYVKKVVFPLDTLCIAAIGEGLFQALVSLCILFLGNLVFLHTLPWTIVMLPVVLIPAILLILGLSWFLASLGVFVRDVAAGIGVVTMMLFFMTPILYPVSMVPERFRFLLKLNPLAVLVESCRRLVMWGQMPEWRWLAYAAAVGLVCFCFGFAFFRRTKKFFADVM
jgi:lipopolysaccharide transport system permease protein